jgi:type II secretory pathway pseudopilin PulG
MSQTTPPRRGAPRLGNRRGGFTLIEALAAIMLMVIVIPTLLNGFGIASKIATYSRQRADATALAQSKLDEIVATQSWQTGMTAGDEKVGVYTYHYEATIGDWDKGEAGIQQLTMTVSWNDGARNLQLTTLLWQPGSTIQTTSSGGSLP